MDILVGFTGFVGSNLLRSRSFDGLFNSANIAEAYGSAPDCCVYAGVRAEKFIANAQPELDYQAILGAIENIKQIKPKRLILISTADVYAQPNGVDENTPIDVKSLQPYGANRRCLEEWVLENINPHHIIRLPGLFGENLKKNFIYDLIHLLPSMLAVDKYMELSQKETLIKKYYIPGGNSFYRLACEGQRECALLRQAFERSGFSALNFTDSRAVFQFYPLNRLWGHINMALRHNIGLLNITTEPVGANEIYQRIRGKVLINELPKPVPYYDIRTVYDSLLGGQNGYLIGKEQILSELCAFIQSHQPSSGV